MFNHQEVDKIDTTMLMLECPLASKEPLAYLLALHNIFSMGNEPKLTQTMYIAAAIFREYYKSIVLQYNTLNEMEAKALEVEHEHLCKFWKNTNIRETDYEIRTKIKALYVSVFIRRTVELQMEANPKYFENMKTQLTNMLNTPAAEEVHKESAKKNENWSIPRLTIRDDSDAVSLTRFYIGLKEAQRWQTHAKWEKLAFYVASMTTGEGVWYCPGGAAKLETMRRKQLFQIIEKLDNKYSRVVRKKRVVKMAPKMAMPPMINPLELLAKVCDEVGRKRDSDSISVGSVDDDSSCCSEGSAGKKSKKDVLVEQPSSITPKMNFALMAP